MIKNIIYFVIIFILIYLGPISLVGVKISVLWKIFPISLLLIYLLLNKNILFIFKIGFAKWSFILAIISLFNLGIFTYPIEGIIQFVNLLIIPLLSVFLIFKYFSKPEKILNIIYNYSVFIILSSLPFILKILTPIGDARDLSMFGVNQNSFVGVFEKPHPAAIMLSFACVFLLYKIFIVKDKILLNSVLFFYGLYPLYLTYVRTAYAIVFFCFIYILFSLKLNIKSFFVISLSISIACSTFYYLYHNDSAFKYRIDDEREIKKAVDSSDDYGEIGSGRVRIWEGSIQNFLEYDFYEILIGVGPEVSKDRLKDRIGQRLFPHNGFLAVLVENGILGLFLFLLFLKSFKNFKTKFRKVYFIAFITFIFFQGNSLIYLNVFLSLVLSYLYLLKSSNYKHINEL